jgi:outer membrane receptor protein involved in Fe transport
LLAVTLLALLLSEDPQTAEKPAAATPEVHEEMVVTAERGPEPIDDIAASVSVLTREQIARLPAQDLSELLEFLPGFHAYFRESFGGPPPIITSRGFFGGGEAEYVQLRINGVPVQDVETGVVDWRRIRAADIERIEALRGPSSSLYGDTALGGVIQVFTREGTAGAPAAAVSAFGGSHGTAGADLSYGFGSSLFQGRGAGTYSRTNGYRDHNSEERGILGFTSSGAALGGKWSADVSASRDLREDPGALEGAQFDRDSSFSDPIYRYDHTDTDRGRIGLAFQKEEGAVPFQATLYTSAREAGILRTLLEAPEFPNRTFRDLHASASGGSLQGQKSFNLFGREAMVRVGAEGAYQTLHTNYRFVDDAGVKGPIVSSEDGSRNAFGAFLTGDWALTDRIRLSGGVRWDHINDKFNVADKDEVHEAWSPRVGLNVRLGDLAGAPVAAYFQASRSFKAPTLDQLFDPHPFDDFQGGTFTISNPNLVPETADNYEIGLSQQGKDLRWEVLGYRMTVEDEIDFDPATFTYKNIGQSLHRGVEASARMAIGPIFTPFVSYAWTRVEARTGEHTGKQLKNIPEQLVSAGLGMNLPAGITAEAIWTYMADRWLDDDNLYPLGNASVVDLRVAKTFGNLGVRLDLGNLTNTTYSQYGYALFSFLTQQQVPYYYPGAGFTARIGIDWKN